MSLKNQILNAGAKLVRALLRLRYNIEIKGLAKLLEEKNFSRPGGVVFLCNHPAIIDPVIVYSALWEAFKPRPVATEYVYETPLISALMNWMRGIAVPDFDMTGNILKKRRADESFRKIKQGLKDGDAFVINPAGRLKSSGVELIGGASWASRLVQEVPEANVVLVRVDGLWGSLFSRASSGKTPSILESAKKALKIIFKNFIFFAPRRRVVVEFEIAAEGLPRGEDRRAFNSYLEKWFNRYEHTEHDAQGKAGLGEALRLVSYSFLREELLEVRPNIVQEDDGKIDVSRIPRAVQEDVRKEIARITKKAPAKLLPQMDLSKDLGMDSLDGAELILFLDDRFDIKGVKPQDLTTIAKVMALAAGQVDLGLPEDDESDLDALVAKWKEKWKRTTPTPPEGKTLHEAFLRQCDRMGDAIACSDRLAGVLTYRQMKMRALLLADEIKRMPGDHIGIMLPASVAVNVCILATLLAGKVPVMINWTVGERHLKSCIESARLHVVLTSRKFTDQLEGVNLSPLVSVLVMLEDMRQRISLIQKLKALFESYRKASAILEDRNAWYADPHGPAVILFTSGTESLPKGVPLSHRNILSNHRAIFAVVNLHSSDVIYGILPPFHSFGFTVTGLLPLVSGLKVVFSPNPTDSIRLARGIARWGITIVCSAPTFLKGILHAATPEQLKTVRLFVSGAEKASADLFDQIASLGGHKELIEGYGITECSPVLTINQPGKPLRGVGKPVPNVQVCIVDIDTHSLLPQGQMGLIIVRGPSVFAGYLDSSTRSPFLEIDGKTWYNTGDLGYIDNEGYLILSGRLKRFVKIGGEMISLGSIEDILQVSFGVDSGDGKSVNLAVTAIEEAGKKTQIFLITTLDIDLEQANEALVKNGMPNLARLAGVQHVAQIPLTGTGKIAYRELANLINSL